MEAAKTGPGEWIGNGYIIWAVNGKLGHCRREGTQVNKFKRVFRRQSTALVAGGISAQKSRMMPRFLVSGLEGVALLQSGAEKEVPCGWAPLG